MKKEYHISATVRCFFPVIATDKIVAKSQKEAIRIFRKKHEGYTLRYVRCIAKESKYTYLIDGFSAPKRDLPLKGIQLDGYWSGEVKSLRGCKLMANNIRKKIIKGEIT